MAVAKEYSHTSQYIGAYFASVCTNNTLRVGSKIQRHIPTSPYVEVEQLIVKYGQQMVIKHRTDGPIHTFLYRTQSNWLKTNFQKMGCQKINSTNVEGKIKPVYQSTIIGKRIVWSSVPKFVQRTPLRLAYTSVLLTRVLRAKGL